MAGLSLLVGLAGATTYALVRDPSYVAPPPRSAAPQAHPAQAAVALHALVVALEARDPAAAADLAPDDDPAAATLLRAVAGNAADLGLMVDLRYVDETGAVAPDGSWSAAVAATWRYAADRTSARAELTVGFRPVTDDAVTVTGFGGADAPRVPVWLAGPVTVLDADGVEVVVSGTGASADRAATRYLRLAERAVVVVHRVLPGWRANLVVEVPESSAALDRALGSEPGHYRSIAAVTATVDGSSAGEAPVHVFVNPDVFDRLRATGAQVVVSHEAVHVATDAARSSIPLWLLEGFADYVALRDVDLPITTTAGQIIRQVRREGVPPALPGPAEFDTGTAHLGATYESAWLACVVLADTNDERALVSLYDDVASGRPLAGALRRWFGLTEAQLTRRWQRRLSDLAG